ncbi:hypothetical protein J7L68_01785 [bacterium]|nr:hypothetical protein [bacterium]
MNILSTKLKRAKNIILTTQIGMNLLVAFAISGILLWGLILLNGYFWFDIAVRSAFFLIWFGSSIFALLVAVIPPLLKPPSLRMLAIEFERKYPNLQEHLIAAYDLANENPDEYGYSRFLVKAIVDKANKLVSGISPKKLLPLGRVLERFGLLALILLLIAGTATAVPDRFAQGTIRIFYPRTPFSKITETTLSISMPNSGKAVKFDDYTITIESSGKLPDKVWVYRKLGRQGYSPFESRRDPMNKALFKYTFRKLMDNVEFFVIGGDFKSKTYTVNILDLPRVLDISLEYHFPKYTHLATQKIERNDGNIDVLYGTNVKIEAKVSKDVKRAEIVLDDTIKIPMKCDDRKVSGNLIIKNDGAYSINVWDENGNSDPQPPRYTINSQPDEAPIVQITLPGKDVDINEDMLVQIQVYGEDDFGFSKFKLRYSIITQDSTVHSFELPFSLFGKKQITLDFRWELDPLGIIPGDLVKYWLEGYDNDFIGGPKMGKSKVYSLRFPSIEEIIKEVNDNQDNQTESVDEAIKAQKDFIEKTEELTRQIQKDNENISYEQKEQVQQLIQQQQQLTQQLQQTAEQMKNTIEKIQEHNVAAQQIVEKMWQIQKLLDEIMPEEMKDAIRKMQEALKQMDPELLKQAMKQLKISQKELAQKLDKTLELLKRIKAEMKLDELKNLAQRIKDLQDKINKGLKSNEDTKKLERMEKEAKEQLQNLEKQAKELSEDMKQFEDMPSDEMKKLADELEKQNLPNEAQNAQQQMQSGNRKKAQKSGQKISEQMKKMSEKLGNLQNQMNKMLQQKLSLDIQRTVRELLYISDAQERLMNDIGNVRDRKKIIDYAVKQDELRTALKLSINRVYNMGGKTLLLPPAVGAKLAESDKQMEQAIKSLAQGYGMSAERNQSEALGGLNAAAEILLRSMNSMCNSSSASGMQKLMQQLQSMCNKQGQLNSQSLPLMGACQNPGGLTPQQRAMASRLSAEQAQLRKTLEQLQNEFKQHSNLLGRMDQTIEDMKNVEQDLKKFNVNDRTLKRQDRILSRMLDAQKSMHKREFTEKRRSRTGEDIVRKSPDHLPDDLGERRDLLQQSLLQILSNPYPRQYQGEVRKYFRALEKEKTAESSGQNK